MQGGGGGVDGKTYLIVNLGHHFTEADKEQTNIDVPYIKR